MLESLPAATYALAEAMLDHRRAELLPGERLDVTWIDGARCWFRQDDETGHRYRLADVEAATVRPAFDHDRLAHTLSRATGSTVTPERLGLCGLKIDAESITFDFGGSSWHADLDTGQLAEADVSLVPRHSTRNAPGSKWRALSRDHNLWLHRDDTGETRRLTNDGTALAPVGEEPDAAGERHLVSLLGRGPRPPRALWSPHGTRLLTHVIDQSAVGTQVLVNHDPPGGGRSVAHEYRYALPGEKLPTGRWRIVGLDGYTVEVDAPFDVPYLSPVTLRQIWWDPSGEAIYWVRHTRDRTGASLVEIDPSTGRTRTVVEETADHRVDVGPYFYEPPVVAVSRERGTVAWFSQRDGEDRLYSYDLASGDCQGALTPQGWQVREILHVGPRGMDLAVASPDGRDPYVRSWARLDWDGGMALIVDDGLDHRLTSSPDGCWFLDGQSDAGTPPIWQLRDPSGNVVLELARTDATALLQLGWQPPERITVSTADGGDVAYGVLHRPFGFDPGRRYPLVDHMYPGPQVHRSDPAFYGAHRDDEAAALAALGFVVLTLDGRGTPGRGRHFHDHSRGNLGSAGCLDDHVAAVKQLVQRYPWIDQTRVGAVGHSAGGFAATKAALTRPDVYKVAVALAGNHDNRLYNASWGEAFDNSGHGVDGRSSNVELTELRARLLLMHGGMDDNVLPDHTLRLVSRLVEADQDIDMLILPRAEHSFYGYEHHVLRRTWDYLVRHLLTREPPAYRLGRMPASPAVMSRVFDAS